MHGGQRQRGSLLGAVMVLLLLGLLLLNGIQRQLDAIVRLGAGERRYLLAYNQAASGLSWGLSQRWSLAEGLVCQQDTSGVLRSCLTPIDAQEEALLWAGGELSSLGHDLRLYRRVRLLRHNDQQEPYALQALPQGWLDYCPAGYRRWCE